MSMAQENWGLKEQSHFKGVFLHTLKKILILVPSVNSELSM